MRVYDVRNQLMEICSRDDTNADKKKNDNGGGLEIDVNLSCGTNIESFLNVPVQVSFYRLLQDCITQFILIRQSER